MGKHERANVYHTTTQVLTPENVAQWMSMLRFEKVADRKYDIVIEGLGINARVSEVQNTVLKEPLVAKNIPTVAEQTQACPNIRMCPHKAPSPFALQSGQWRLLTTLVPPPTPPTPHTTGRRGEVRIQGTGADGCGRDERRARRPCCHCSGVLCALPRETHREKPNSMLTFFRVFTQCETWRSTCLGTTRLGCLHPLSPPPPTRPASPPPPPHHPLLATVRPDTLPL